MANYVLDLNSAERPTMDLTMPNAERTRIRVSTPTEGMVQELQNLSTELDNIRKGDRTGVALIYDLAARLISCNRDFLKVTAEELRTKYNMDLESMIVFFSAYLDFINGIMNAKN